MFHHHTPLKSRPGAARSSSVSTAVRPAAKRKPLIEALEPRLLLSADLPNLVGSNLVVTPNPFALGAPVTVQYTLTNSGTAAAIEPSAIDRFILSRDTVIDANDVVMLGAQWSLDRLGAGESVVLSTEVSLPPEAFVGTGSWFLIVDIDGLGNVQERNEADNTVARQISLVVPNRADLIVTNIRLPDVIVAEEDFVVRWTTTNRGVLAASHFLEAVSWTRGRGFLDDRTAVWFEGTLRPGESVERSATVRMSHQNEGVGRLVVTTDWRWVVDEGNSEGNNQTEIDAEVARARLPDLVVTSIAAPTRAFNGQPIQFSFDLANVGPVGVGAGGVTSVEIWLSDESGTEKAVRIADRNVEVALAAGETRTIRVDANWNAVVPATVVGDRRLIVELDPWSPLFEGSGVGNNMAIDDVPITLSDPPLPDLVATDVRIVTRGPLRHGDRIEFDIDVRNAGNAADTREWQGIAWLTRDGVLDGDDEVEFGGFPVWSHAPGLSIGAGQTRTVRTTLAGRTDLAAGAYTLVFQLDRWNGVRESNETNNTLTLPVQLEAWDGGFRVTSVRANDSGFSMRFSRVMLTDEVELYVASRRRDVMAPAFLFGNPVSQTGGTIVVDRDRMGFTFLQTGAPLAPGGYMAAVSGRAEGWRDEAGRSFQGYQNGLWTTGDQAYQSFTVLATDRQLSLPDVMRGPGQALSAGASVDGLPVRLSDGTGVQTVSFFVRFDATQIAIDGVIARAGTTATATAISAGVMRVDVLVTEALPTGAIADLVKLQGRVLAGARYADLGVIDVGDVVVNGGALTASGDEAVMVVGFIGDMSGNGRYSAVDSQRLMRVVSRLNTHFSAWPNVDPRIIGDVNGSGVMNATDVQLLMRRIGGRVVPQIPAIPAPAPAPAPRAMALMDLQTTMTAGETSSDGPVDWSARFADDGADSKATSRSVSRTASVVRGPTVVPISTR